MSSTTLSVNIVAPESDQLPMNNSQPIEENNEYDEYEYEDDEEYFSCAYCDQERGYVSMDYMCADCFWDYDSLRKRPRRIVYHCTLGPMTEERKAEIQSWLEDARSEIDEFEARLDEGIARIKGTKTTQVTTTQATTTETTTTETTTTNENKEKTE